METKELAEIGILGALNERGELSQSEMQKFLQDTFSEYWGYGSGVLSPATKRLIENNSIKRVTKGSNTKYRYEITSLGKEKLDEFLRSPIEERDLMNLSSRHQLVIKLGFLHHLPKDDQESVLNNMKSNLAERLGRWEAIQEEYHASNTQTGYREDFVQLKIEILEAHIEWIEELDLKSISSENQW